MFEQRRHNEAEAVCQRGLELHPQDGVLHRRQQDCFAISVPEDMKTHPTGHSLASLQQTETMSSYFKKVLDLKPEINDIEIVSRKSELYRSTDISKAYLLMSLACGRVG